MLRVGICLNEFVLRLMIIRWLQCKGTCLERIASTNSLMSSCSTTWLELLYNKLHRRLSCLCVASREDGMHDHLDMTFTDFQACVAGKSEQNVRKVLPSDSELGQYEFFPIEVVDFSALMSLHEDDDRYQCWRQVKLRAWQFPKCWPVARLTCAGLRVLLNPVAVDDFNWEVSLKLQQVDLQTAGKRHDIIQGVERVLRRPLRLGPEQPLDLELLAHHLYRRTGMGREDWGFDIVDEIVTRWKPIAKRRTVDDDLEITEEAYTVMEAETIRECWEHAFVGCNPDAFVDYDGMRPFLQQTVAHGYGRCEKPRNARDLQCGADLKANN